MEEINRTTSSLVSRELHYRHLPPWIPSFSLSYAYSSTGSPRPLVASSIPTVGGGCISAFRSWENQFRVWEN
ncbi:hypothetical protein SESBI_46102 [Sesbania bispinosa]|nr:hypothetical protein SESBI_46102 [Sesbania bispinosa]